MADDLYVDDLADEIDSEDQTISLYKSPKDVTATGGLIFVRGIVALETRRVRHFIAKSENEGIEPGEGGETIANEAPCNQSSQIEFRKDETSSAKVSVIPSSRNVIW